MTQPALPYTPSTSPVEAMTVSLRFRWETAYYDLRTAVRLDGDPDWHVSVYESLTVEEVLDVLAATVRG